MNQGWRARPLEAGQRATKVSLGELRLRIDKSNSHFHVLVGVLWAKIAKEELDFKHGECSKIICVDKLYGEQALLDLAQGGIRRRRSQGKVTLCLTSKVFRAIS